MGKPIPSVVGADFEKLVGIMTLERDTGLVKPPVSPLHNMIAGAVAGLTSDLVLTGNHKLDPRSVGDMSKDTPLQK